MPHLHPEHDLEIRASQGLFFSNPFSDLPGFAPTVQWPRHEIQMKSTLMEST
jgi:hypothetical protein